MRSLALIACLSLVQRIAGQQIWDVVRRLFALSKKSTTLMYSLVANHMEPRQSILEYFTEQPY